MQFRFYRTESDDREYRTAAFSEVDEATLSGTRIFYKRSIRRYTFGYALGFDLCGHNRNFFGVSRQIGFDGFH